MCQPTPESAPHRFERGNEQGKTAARKKARHADRSDDSVSSACSAMSLWDRPKPKARKRREKVVIGDESEGELSAWDRPKHRANKPGSSDASECDLSDWDIRTGQRGGNDSNGDLAEHDR